MTETTSATATPSEPVGVLLVDKPEAPTSHDVVAFVRWALGVQQVGHCGTLDPLATGLLVVCVGAATRLVPYLTGVDKVYRARFGLGRATTTADRAGETIAEAPVGPDAAGLVGHALEDMRGDLMLPPPAYSAVKVDGQRAYDRARKGHAVELAARPMALRSLGDLALAPEAVEATCAVSKGTYIRSLAEELGRRTGIPIHLAALHRIACGPLSLSHPAAVAGLLADRLPNRPGLPPKYRLRLQEAAGQGAGQDDPRRAARDRLRAALLAPEVAVPFPVSRATDALTGLLNGRSAPLDALPAAPPTYAEGLGDAARQGVLFPGGLVVVALQDGFWRPERVIRTSVLSAEAVGTA